VRTARGPRQRVVATLGKLPSLDQEEQRGWEEIERLVEGRESGRQTEFFEPGSRALSSAPQWAQVDLRGLRGRRGTNDAHAHPDPGGIAVGCRCCRAWRSEMARTTCARHLQIDLRRDFKLVRTSSE
jgi:hypothetical protein